MHRQPVVGDDIAQVDQPGDSSVRRSVVASDLRRHAPGQIAAGMTILLNEGESLDLLQVAPHLFQSLGGQVRPEALGSGLETLGQQ